MILIFLVFLLFLIQFQRNWCSSYAQWPCIILGDFNCAEGVDNIDVFNKGGNIHYITDDVFHGTGVEGTEERVSFAFQHPTNSDTKNPCRYDRILFDSRLGSLLQFVRMDRFSVDDGKVELSDHWAVGVSVLFSGSDMEKNVTTLCADIGVSIREYPVWLIEIMSELPDKHVHAILDALCAMIANDKFAMLPDVLSVLYWRCVEKFQRLHLTCPHCERFKRIED
jgi:hypothetical protein